MTNQINTNPYEPGQVGARNDDNPELGCFAFLIVLFLCVVGIIGLLAGSPWLYVFTLTDYRAHHAPIMIPVGVLSIVFSVLALWFAKFLVRPGPRGKPPHARDLE